MPPPPIDEELREYQAAQYEMLAEAKAAEAELAPLYQETSQAIQAKLRADPDNLNGAELRKTIDDEFTRTLPKRRRIIAEVIEVSAKKGRRASHKTFRAVFGEQATDAQVRATRKAMGHAGDRIAGRVTVDKVALSRRIRAHDKEIGDQLAREVQKGIRARKGIETIAKRIQAIDTTVESELPKYLREVEALARAGNVPEMKALAKRYAARVKKTLGALEDGARKATPYSLRAPTQRFLRDVQKAGADGIDGVVREYVEQKAQWRAKVIARSEATDAMRRSYIEQAKNKPGVLGFQHKLSGSHPRPDICDYWASANLYAMGPGVYPADRLPRVHPLCKCYQVAVIDRQFAQRGEQTGVPPEYQDHTSPGGHEWLKRNPDKAAAILGPSRHALLKQGRPVVDAQHQLIPVGHLLPQNAHAAE